MSSNLTRSSQTTLCNICAHGLSLDDRRAGGVLKKLSGDGGPSLCFYSRKEREISGWGDSERSFIAWKGGAQYETRDITPPHLPELSDECKFCRTVKRVLLDEHGRHEWWQTTATKIQLYVQYEWLSSEGEGNQFDFKLNSLKVEPYHSKIDLNYHSIEFPVATSSDSCKEWLHITGRRLDAESPISESNVNLIRSWVEQCDTDSSCCRPAKQEEFLPTRLLDVGGSNDPSITLIETDSMTQLDHADHPLKYICLSYTWGSKNGPLKTEESTIESHKSGIPMDSMPRVFRDAVLVTRTLGVRYLWIDALCIIQGCAEDWHNESAAMADVFSHSWMTIGAAATSSCHDTLFCPRQDLSIDIEFQSSIERKITGTISITLLSDYFKYPLRSSLENSTWDTRGWVWQEQKLSQRLLIFGVKMLHLRCHQRLLHEFGTHQPFGWSEETEVAPDGPGNWSTVMDNYSRRELSKGSDRLAAISGFAKAISQELEDAGKPTTYIAGIWLAEDEKVIHQLFWLLDKPSISFRRLLHYHSDPEQYIAPSWSWLALNQPVWTTLANPQPVIRIVTHNIQPARSNPTISIAPRSSITLFGKLRNIPGRPSMDNRNKHWWSAPYSCYEGALQSWKTWGGNKDTKITYCLDWDPSSENSGDGDLEDYLQLFLLGAGSYGTSSTGLILFPDTDHPSSFLRVGVFKIIGLWDSPDWRETEVIII